MKLMEKILVPVIVSQVSDSQIKVAIELARKFNSKLILLHVLPLEAKLGNVNSIILDYVEKDFDKLIEQISGNGIQAEKHIVYGNMFEQIILQSELHLVNLILVPDNFKLYESKYSVGYLVEKLIRKSEKPVWVVKENSDTLPKTIMCSVDFSEAAERALINAIKIARVFKTKLDIVNVFEPLEEHYSPRYDLDYEAENQELEGDNVQEFTDFIGKFNLTDVNYETVVLKGKPYKRILEYAQQQKIDILFMGATGKSFIQRLLLGSVTELIVRELPCSMVITKTENILNLKIDKDISDLEKILSNAKHLEETGFYEDAIVQLNMALKINDLHLPAIYSLVRLFTKTNNLEQADSYNKKADEILRRLWNKKIELEIRKGLK